MNITWTRQNRLNTKFKQSYCELCMELFLSVSNSSLQRLGGGEL
jgi:hypothetical protein